MPITTRTMRNKPQSSQLPVDVAKTVGGRLRDLRKAQGITLVELAKASGVDTATISRIETGSMTGTLESHTKLSRALGVRLTQLYAGIEEAQTRDAVSVQGPSTPCRTMSGPEMTT